MTEVREGASAPRCQTCGRWPGDQVHLQDGGHATNDCGCAYRHHPFVPEPAPARPISDVAEGAWRLVHRDFFKETWMRIGETLHVPNKLADTIRRSASTSFEEQMLVEGRRALLNKSDGGQGNG